VKRALKYALGVAGATTALAAFNDWVRWNVGPVPRWVNGEPHFYQWREGAVYYEAAGRRDAPPLLLAHGINAAASSYEMRKIFAPLAENFRVYLPDLLGYGRSERPRLRYTADTYVDLWSDFVRDVCQAEEDRPVHVVASSLTAAHVVAAAGRHPQRFGSLLLVCPTGIKTLASRPKPAQLALYALFATPVLGTALFNGLASRPSIGSFLRRQAYSSASKVTADVVRDYYIAGHQPGAKWAPAAFVSGQLNCQIADTLARLPNRLYLAWGRAATITPLDQAEAFRRIRPDLTLQVFQQSGLLPHDEEPEAFVRWTRRVLL
jgi:pimeloyl-ACP methyl ester carboxylesterase